MTAVWPFVDSLLVGPLCSAVSWPYTMHARCCDLRARFRVKQTVRSGCRAISRNGRILLCADCPLEELPGRPVRFRLQTWHRIYLPGDAPQPHGVLLCVRGLDNGKDAAPSLFEMRFVPFAEARGELRIDVGGRMLLDFCLVS